MPLENIDFESGFLSLGASAIMNQIILGSLGTAVHGAFSNIQGIFPLNAHIVTTKNTFKDCQIFCVRQNVIASLRNFALNKKLFLIPRILE